MDYTNKALGLRVQTQIPLNVKKYKESEESLKDLGINNNLAFIYEQGLIVYCIQEGTRWEWKENVASEEGLLDSDFIYPDNTITFGIDYSNKRYNFFQYGQPDGSETKVTAGTNVTVTGNGTVATPYTINAIVDGSETKINSGTNVTITGSGTNATPYVVNSTNTTYTAGNGINLTGTVFSLDNLQKVITYPTDFSGTNYTLTNADNNYEIIIDNGATAVTITVPSGLTSKIGVGFTQKGSGNVTYITSGTTINNPIGLKIKGQYYQTFLSQELSTNNYFLGGNTKL